MILMMVVALVKGEGLMQSHGEVLDPICLLLLNADGTADGTADGQEKKKKEEEEALQDWGG